MHHHLEAMLRAGQNEAVLEEAERLFASPGVRGRRTNGKEQLWTAVWACRAAGGLRRWGEAVRWADEGLALLGDDSEAEGILRFSVARALMYTGDLLRAETELRRFLSLAQSSPKLEKSRADALYNLGHLMRLLGRNADAVRAFAEAEAAYRGYGRLMAAALARYDQGWTLLLDDRPDEALPELEGVRAMLASLSAPELETDLEIACALYHSLIGELEQSDRLCAALLETSLLPYRQRAELEWILGTNALRRGDLSEAATHMVLAHQAAVEDWWPPQIDRVNRLREGLIARQGSGR